MKRFICINGLALLLIIMVSCSKSHETEYVTYNNQVIHIGVLISLTGTGYSAGQSSQASLEIAREDLMNYFHEAGLEQKIILEYADTKTETSEALKQLETFYEKGIRLVIGPYSSAELSAIRGFAEDHGMLVVSPSSVAVSLAIPNDNIFRFVSCDLIQGKAMAKMLSGDNIRIMIPVIRDDVWGNDLLNATAMEFKKSGGNVSASIKYNPENPDFSGTLAQLETAVSTALKTYDPNQVAVNMLSFAEGAGLLSGAGNHTAMNNVYWYGSSAFAENSSVLTDTNAALFAYTHGLPCPVFGLDESAKAKWQYLQERIRDRIGRLPDVYAITAYDALWVMTMTMLKTGVNAEIEKIKTVFTVESDNYFGASGHTRLDTNGDRAIGNYDFWAVKRDSNGYCWKKTATYNSNDGTLIRFKP